MREERSTRERKGANFLRDGELNYPREREGFVVVKAESRERCRALNCDMFDAFTQSRESSEKEDEARRRIIDQSMGCWDRCPGLLGRRSRDSQ